MLESKNFLIDSSHEFNNDFIFSSDIFGRVQMLISLNASFNKSSFECSTKLNSSDIFENESISVISKFSLFKIPLFSIKMSKSF
jgi:hypothetical protein